MMTAAPEPTSLPEPTQSHAALSLALTFLLVGLGYGLPVWLAPPSHPMRDLLAPEILNLYLLTAWLGLSHFLYAYRGHLGALRRYPKRLAGYLVALCVAGLLLALARHHLGMRLFSALAWVYFIPHFIKAELHFSNRWVPADAQASTMPLSRLVTLFPTAAFATFTWALFMPTTGWLRLGVVGLILTGFTCWGGWRLLRQARLSSVLLLGFFFLGEALAWGAYRRYMDAHFQLGIYIVHVAMASFYHYARAYHFAQQYSTTPHQLLSSVVLTNVALVAVGWTVLHVPALAVFGWLFNPQTFTFWVALHLVMSDTFNWQKRLSV